MQFLLCLYDNENLWNSMNEAEQEVVFAAYGAYTEALKKADAFHSGEPLMHSSTGAIVRAPEGKEIVQDGPFTDTKEQLGGFYRIMANNLDDALNWAAKCPAAETGTIEVRPVWEMD